MYGMASIRITNRLHVEFESKFAKGLGRFRRASDGGLLPDGGFRSETYSPIASSVIAPCALCGRAPTVVAPIYVLQDNCFTLDFRALKTYTFERERSRTLFELLLIPFI